MTAIEGGLEASEVAKPHFDPRADSYEGPPSPRSSGIGNRKRPPSLVAFERPNRVRGVIHRCPARSPRKPEDEPGDPIRPLALASLPGEASTPLDSRRRSPGSSGASGAIEGGAAGPRRRARESSASVLSTVHPAQNVNRATELGTVGVRRLPAQFLGRSNPRAACERVGGPASWPGYSSFSDSGSACRLRIGRDRDLRPSEGRRAQVGTNVSHVPRERIESPNGCSKALGQEFPDAFMRICALIARRRWSTFPLPSSYRFYRRISRGGLA